MPTTHEGQLPGSPDFEISGSAMPYNEMAKTKTLPARTGRAFE
jgi:hypothetical protein